MPSHLLLTVRRPVSNSGIISGLLTTRRSSSVVRSPWECHRVFICIVFCAHVGAATSTLRHHYWFWHLTKKAHFSVSTYLYHKKEHAGFFSCHGCAIAPAYDLCFIRVDIKQIILRPSKLKLINHTPPSWHPTAIGISAKKSRMATWREFANTGTKDMFLDDRKGCIAYVGTTSYSTVTPQLKDIRMQ